MSEPGAPTPTPPPNPYATPTTPPPSYDEHRAGSAQQQYPPYVQYLREQQAAHAEQPAYPQPPYRAHPQQPYGPGTPYGPGKPWPVGPAPEHKPGTNGFAIAALVFGLIGGIPLALVFGFIALGQTANGRQKGRGMAIAGLIGAGVWLAGIVAAVVYAAATAPERDDSGSITEQGTLSAYDIEIGDCLNGLRAVEADTIVTTLPAVPCTEAHEGEVYASFELADGDYPGADGVMAEADRRCAEALLTYSVSAYEDQNIGLFYLYPDSRDWVRNREVVCIAMAIEGTLTASIAE